jgi:hypothetical protein
VAVAAVLAPVTVRAAVRRADAAARVPAVVAAARPVRAATVAAVAGAGAW